MQAINMLTTETINEWAVLIVGVGGAAGVLIAAWRFAHSKVITPVAQVFQQIDELAKVVKPNGGTSLYDRVHSIGSLVAQNEARSRTLVESLGIGEWHSDTNGNCIFINSAACFATNRLPDEFLGRNWVNVVAEYDRERVEREWDDAVKTRRRFVYRYHWTKQDGTPIAIRAVSSLVHDGIGNLTGWVALVHFENDAGQED